MSVKPIIIDGAHATLFDEFIAYKRNMGYGYSHPIMERLRQFSRFLAKFPTEDGVLTKALADAYCEPKEGEAVSTRNNRLSLSRQFALFLNSKGIQTYVPPEQRQKKTSNFIPFIITEAQMADIIKCADETPFISHASTTKYVYPMLLRLLWCCGLRLGEAIHLRLQDVDIDAGVLTVRKAKYNQTRLIPISATLLEYIRTYRNKMQFSLREPDAFFLPTHRDGNYSRSSAAINIKRIMLRAGVTKDGVKPPRVHDIRHSYAVRALKKMADENVDIYCALPMLSIFMGHSDIKSTEYYLRLTGHVFSDVATLMEPAYATVFPEVCDENG